MKYKYNYQNLSKHGVSVRDVDEVLAEDNISTRNFDLPLSDNENLRVMFVGFNAAGRLLEIGVEFQDELRAYIFHTQAISPTFRRFYEGCITNEN